jgi:serine/threonine protein kinase
MCVMCCCICYALQDSSAPLGCGGYGTVYRGRLRGGTQVAIKVLNDDSQQGQREFEKEVAILGGLHHEHLLPLLGSCSERHALVYPLMQGSLEQRLQWAAPASTTAAAQGTSSSSTATPSAEPLPWLERLRICNEVVLGLIWLHTQEPPILHMDLKTAHILLDRCGVAAVVLNGHVTTTAWHSGHLQPALSPTHGPWQQSPRTVVSAVHSVVTQLCRTRVAY